MRSTTPSACARSLPVALFLVVLVASAAWAEDPPGTKEKKVVEAGSNVSLEYTLTLEDGTKVDSNVGGEPLQFQQGSQQIIPGLDEALLGMAAGDSKTVTVPPETGYGPVNPEAFTKVPLSELPEDGREPGSELVARDPSGHLQRLRVDRIEGEEAVLDFNHPLAGKTLTFDVKVLEVQ